MGTCVLRFAAAAVWAQHHDNNSNNTMTSVCGRTDSVCFLLINTIYYIDIS